MIPDKSKKNVWRRLAWSRRGALGAAVFGAFALEGAYGCVGETGTEDFIEENIGEVEDALVDAPSYFSCKIGVSPTTQDDCSGTAVVKPLTASGIQRRVEIDLDAQKSWKTFVLRTRVCDATGWTVNIGDSPTNDGWGGDTESTSHDAEAQALNGALAVYRSDIGSGNYLACQFAGPPSTAGCITQDWIINNDSLKFDSNTGDPSNALKVCTGAALFDFPGYDEADAEDPTCTYADKLYVGLNGVVDGDPSRVGTGVQQACFFLSDSTTYDAAAVTARCGDMSASLVAPTFLSASWTYYPVLTWNDLSSGESGYRVERSFGAGTTFALVGANQIGVAATDLDAAAIEKLAASAKQKCRDSGYNDQAINTIESTSQSGGSYAYWEADQWKVGSSASVFYLDSVDCVNGWTEIGTTAPNATTYTDTGNTVSEYPLRYRVRAYNAGNFSPYSPVATVKGVIGGGN